MGFFSFVSLPKALLIFLVIASSHISCEGLPSVKNPPGCISDHFSALLEFKADLLFSYRRAENSYHSKTNLSSWTPENRNCCAWEGITCDNATGHVMSLCLSHLNISGKINFKSLSRIRSLQILNLDDNRFYDAPISSAVGNLTSLTHFNLSYSRVIGQIPLELSSLTRLVSLDLSLNGYYNHDGNLIPLKLERLGAVIQSMSSLRELHLDYVNMSSAEGSQCDQARSANFPTTLRTLSMYQCNLCGTIHWFTNLTNLQYLDISNNNFGGNVPSSLFAVLPSLRSLKLSGNQLTGQLNEFHNSTKLEYIDISNNNFSGNIPSSLFALPSLRFVKLSHNQLTGRLSEFNNSTKLEFLDLSSNNLNGIIPSSLFILPSLRVIRLWGNQFGGQLSEFPNSSISLLETIDLYHNMLQGTIPMSIFQLKKLKFLVLNANMFTGVLELHIFKNLKSLFYLDLGGNQFEGSIPIPPPSIAAYLLYSNRFSGQIPMSICNAASLDTFHVGDNNLSGRIPPCFGEMVNTLINLKLGENSLSGSFFQTFKEGCSLEELDLGQNQLQGRLPLSLANCTRLAILNVSSNQLQDTFPLWVQGLAYLRILILRSNNFYGPIQPPPTCQNFSQLLIFDLSFNNFDGGLPSNMFCGWKIMTGEDNFKLEYLQRWVHGYSYYYYKEGTLRIKRLKIDGVKISTIQTIVDFSSNNFRGKIPEAVGTLKALWSLNLSHNGFAGPIPLSLKNLTTLESLDLSHNKLSGNIPPEFANLTFLSTLDLSENQLTGSIPHGKQFSTFTNESFDGNPGLCGPPLSKMCQGTHVAPSPTSPDEDEESISESEFDWRMVAIAFGIGYGVGLGAFCWTFVLWTKGRIAFNTFLYKMVLLIFPSLA